MVVKLGRFFVECIKLSMSAQIAFRHGSTRVLKIVVDGANLYRWADATPHRPPDLSSCSLSTVQTLRHMIDQHTADDAAFCVCHPNHAQHTAAVRTLRTLWLTAFPCKNGGAMHLRDSSAFEPLNNLSLRRVIKQRSRNKIGGFRKHELVYLPSHSLSCHTLL